MDECLVHAEVAGDRSIQGCHQHTAERLPNAREADAQADFEFELPYLDSPVRVFKRPALDEFLGEARKVWRPRHRVALNLPRRRPAGSSPPPAVPAAL